jgi:hypothetical protein
MDIIFQILIALGQGFMILLCVLVIVLIIGLRK